MTGTDDADLMLEVRAGRTGALAELFERHHAALYRYCLRLVGDRHAAEDLVQDVFMKMLRYRKSFRNDAGFTPWMFRIARNACVDLLRSTPAPSSETDPDEIASQDASAETQASDQQHAALVRRAIAALPLTQREALVLSRFEFKTYEEIAHVLGCSVGAVKVRVHRAIRQLRSEYRLLAQENSA